MTSDLSKLEQVRADKLHKLRAMGIDPWGGRFDDKTPIAQLRGMLDDDAPAGSSETGPAVRAAGRILSLRDKGKLVFIDLHDKTGRIQLMIGRKQVGEENWAAVELLDLWDLIGVDGTLGRTRAGELTIFVTNVTLLTKTLAHPPEKFHGAQDVELLLRRRYIDLIQNPATLHRFETRAKIIQFIRRDLSQREYIEVETPTMHAIAGGAAARPFITHHNALDIDLYLRIALELPLKRLLVGGMERVYEIGRVWRNEGIDARHNPEFTMLELYQAYGDYRTMMDLTEGLIAGAVDCLGGTMKLTDGEEEVDFSPPWRRATYDELLREYVGVGMEDTDAVIAEAKRRGLEIAGKHPDVLVSELFETFVEDHLHGPIFVMDYPASLCPLTKRKTSDPRIAERFELYIRGMEIANAYTELNDPLLQEELFSAQLTGLAEDESMARMDRDFVMALMHGMPPAGGLGIGIDRLVMLLTNSPTIRDVILFPQMRPETKPTAGGADAESEAPEEATD